MKHKITKTVLCFGSEEYEMKTIKVTKTRASLKKAILSDIDQARFLLKRKQMKQVDRGAIREFLESAIRNLNSYEMKFIPFNDTNRK